MEMFKFFGNPMKSKNLKSPSKLTSPVILPRMRKTRLKSEICVENMKNVLLDGEYDISKESFISGHVQTQKSPPKSADSVIKSKPPLRRSMRLKSELLDRSHLYHQSDGEDFGANEPANNSYPKTNTNVGGMNTSLSGSTSKKGNHKIQIKKRKLNTDEPLETFLDSINIDDIANMLVHTNICNELQASNISKRRRTTTERSQTILDKTPNKNIKKIDRQTNNITQTEKNDTQISAAKTNHEAKNTNNIFLRSSIKDVKDVTNDKSSQLNETNNEILHHSNEDVNNSASKSSNKGILKYFKVKNKRFDEANECKDSPKKQESAVQSSALANNGNVTNNLNLTNLNNLQNSAQTPKKRGRGRPPKQLIDHENSDQIPIKRGRGRPRKQLIDHENSDQIPIKRGRGRPPKQLINHENVGPILIKRVRGRRSLPVHRLAKKNASKQCRMKSYTKISKLTKTQIKHVEARKIPKNRLDDVLNILDNEDHPIWVDRNTSCNPYIYQHFNARIYNSDKNIKLKYARQFLLRRDWNNLSKILCLFNTAAKHYYPLLAKYASLLLAHTDEEQFNKFIQFLIKFDDSSAVMKTCTKIANEQ